MANIYQKVGVRSRNEAVRKALTEEWFGLEEIIGDGKVGRTGRLLPALVHASSAS